MSRRRKITSAVSARFFSLLSPSDCQENLFLHFNMVPSPLSEEYGRKRALSFHHFVLQRPGYGVCILGCSLEFSGTLNFPCFSLPVPSPSVFLYFPPPCFFYCKILRNIYYIFLLVLMVTATLIVEKNEKMLIALLLGFF